MTTKHTPAPWNVFGNLISAGEHQASAETVATIVTEHNHYWPEGTSEANARLIAAAPDLLTACQAWVAMYEDKEPVPPEVRIAAYVHTVKSIAKALTDNGDKND